MMVCLIIIFSSALGISAVCFILAQLLLFLLVAVAVGSIGAERESEEGEQMGIFYPCTITIIFILRVFVWCFLIFVHELLGFWFLFFFFFEREERKGDC